MKTLKKEYSIESFTIDSDNIDQFQVMKNRRQIGNTQVQRIHGVISKGSNPIGVLIINELNKKWRLIDGNHRLEALKKFYGHIKKNREIKLECILKIYKNLTDEEERQVYSNEAKRRNESHEDRLNMYKETITFWKLTQDSLNKFPCKVSMYNQKDSLRFRTILDSLCTVKSEMKSGYVPRYLSKENLIEFAQDLNFDDFTLIKNFVRIFQETFGNVSKDNILCRRQGFLPLFDIFVKNFRNVSEEKVKKRFSLIIGKSDLLMYLNMQGREAQQKIREIMINYMNKGRMYSSNSVI